jgi:pimeloyl-ACP methyl ester carboxylesterase
LCYLAIGSIVDNTLNVYFISGIGADYRLFTYLQLPEGFEKSYIHWVPPHHDEKLKDYALRLAEQIDTSQPFILAGLSLGGIMAVEIAKKIPPVCTVLISSVPVTAHLPRYYKLAHRLHLSKWVPASLLKAATTIKHSLTMRSSANRKLMRDVIRSGDDRFIEWALNAVLEWENTTIPHPFYHIHGTRDEVFPISLTHPTHIVPKGGHMFLMSQPEVVNAILREIFTPLKAS